MKIALVSCVKTKTNEAVEARDLYQSPLFKKMRRYVELRGFDKWFILSAEHGLLDPFRVISPYETTLKGARKAVKQEWARRVASQMIDALPHAAEITIIAGMDYREHLLPLLDGVGYTFKIPLKGLGIGRQMGVLTKAIKKMEQTQMSDIADEAIARRRLEAALTEFPDQLFTKDGTVEKLGYHPQPGIRTMELDRLEEMPPILGTDKLSEPQMKEMEPLRLDITAFPESSAETVRFQSEPRTPHSTS